MTIREEGFDPLASALNAIANTGAPPAAREDVRAMLETGRGDPSRLRALFGDVELHTLSRLADLFAIDDLTLARAYVRARNEVAAASDELDEFAAQFGL
jgi:hypothetical protein